MIGSNLTDEEHLLNLPFDQYIAEYLRAHPDLPTPSVDQYVAACVKADPEFMAGIREGLRARREGRMRPWSEVEKELGIGEPDV